MVDRMLNNPLPIIDGPALSISGDSALKLGRDMPINESRRWCAMSNNQPEPSKIQDEPLRPQQVLQWEMCQPGVLLLSSLALGTMLACKQDMNQQTIAEPPLETEADIIDGDMPWFI